MENQKEILNRLANIKETQQYLPDDIELILTCLDAEEDFIRAAAVLASEGALYNLNIVDQLFYHFETEQNNNVKKSLIIQIGNFISAGYFEGFEQDSDIGAFSEITDDYNDLAEQQLKERYVQAKDMFFQYLVEYDEYDIFYFNILNALLIFSDIPLIKSKVDELWNVEEENRCIQLFPIIEKFPEQYETQIISVLTESQSIELIIKALKLASKIPSKQIGELVAGFLHSEENKLVAKALIALAEINDTPDLQNILQGYCLHIDPQIQNSAKRALDIYTAKNFNKFMSDYYGKDTS